MGYFEALTNSCFKKASDGRWLFFPFGAFGRGYIIDSEQAYEALRWRVGLFTIAGLVLVLGALALHWLAAIILACALYLPLYVVWVRYLRLEPSREKLSLDESMTSQALAYGAVSLWLFEVLALAFAGLGLFLLVVDSRGWPLSLATIIFFGLCAAVFARMLVLRRRSKAGGTR